ncbi:MAG: hypothetical protein JF887_02650 [Candidatus Dormibacteraeota bacterium]|uniref:Uncharacterized protein n=1 Tax=Candidatus Amunia macphersoniae TaxID=3127014 RepID=A0A934NIP9_9BACT|nr:hypothetical protein [Candidatus Dormibacteraeota bacterium]
MVAVGFYDSGSKFLNVDSQGKISEVGHFLAPGTETSADYWITPNIVYAVDYARGIDILCVQNNDGSGCPATPGTSLSEPPPLAALIVFATVLLVMAPRVARQRRSRA